MNSTKLAVLAILGIVFVSTTQRAYAQRAGDDAYFTCNLGVTATDHPNVGNHHGFSYVAEVFQATFNFSAPRDFWHAYDQWVRSFDSRIDPSQKGTHGDCYAFTTQAAAQSQLDLWVKQARKRVEDYPDVANREGNGYGYKMVQWRPGQTQPPQN